MNRQLFRQHLCPKGNKRCRKNEKVHWDPHLLSHHTFLPVSKPVILSSLLSSPPSFTCSSSFHSFSTCLLPTHLSALSHSPQVPSLPSSLVCSLHNMSTTSPLHLQSPSHLHSSISLNSTYPVWNHYLEFTPARPLLLFKMPPLYPTEMVLTEDSEDLCWPDFGFHPPPSS